jgi:hypothetical protein
MTISIALKPEVENRVRERAAQANVTVEAYIQHLAEQSVSASPAAHELPYEEWVKQFRAWVASHEPGSGIVDDDRETIYAGRGE